RLVMGPHSGFLAAVLPSGSCAVAISIDAQGSSAAGGFILPNDRVDVVHLLVAGFAVFGEGRTTRGARLRRKSMSMM
ncbi:MAG: RcpC/CpaB family pilus assembly protein, partial [Alphaproteobacteria bacterium]|nr:RcpC/CpaB family pilus assembly protein [Alphaproteobacteria bacterium]